MPDINDFTAGLAVALKPGGTITLEFPHLMRLIEHTQFDTVYHEHFSYLSLYTVSRIFARAGLRVWDVEELPTHGGSLRVYGCHAADPRTANAGGGERAPGRRSTRTAADSRLTSNSRRAPIGSRTIFSHFLIEQKRTGKKVAAYGAAAKGNTLLNYAGVKPDSASVCLRRRAVQAGQVPAGQSDSDSAACRAARAAAGRRSHSALEYRRRGHGAAELPFAVGAHDS